MFIYSFRHSHSTIQIQCCGEMECLELHCFLHVYFGILFHHLYIVVSDTTTTATAIVVIIIFFGYFEKICVFFSFSLFFLVICLLYRSEDAQHSAKWEKNVAIRTQSRKKHQQQNATEYFLVKNSQTNVNEGVCERREEEEKRIFF